MYFFHAIVSSCNIVVYLLSNKIDKKSLKILFSFLYYPSTVLYILFHFVTNNDSLSI